MGTACSCFVGLCKDRENELKPYIAINPIGKFYKYNY